MTPHETVLRLDDVDESLVRRMLDRYGLRLERVADDAPIDGSYWGGAEAGLVGARLLARGDTPLHSILHEASHFVCMDGARRDGLNADAGGDYDEENGVCYLQILLSDEVPGMGRARMFADMDAWGYTFRLGSARAWFERDAEDARAWLGRHDLVDDDAPTWRLRA